MDMVYQGTGTGLFWQGDEGTILFDPEAIQSQLKNLEEKATLVQQGEQIGLATGGEISTSEGLPVLALSPAIPPRQLGDGGFLADHGLTLPYFAGSMANGISSVEMVIALGKEGILASYGAAGQLPQVIEEAIERIQAALPNGPYCFNLIHSPNEPALEQEGVNLYLAKGVHCIEASAYLDLTPALVQYRVAGLYRDEEGRIQSKNRIIAKVSRKEVATRFMEPPSEKFLESLLAQGKITTEQAEMSRQLPLAEDVTVEADSGGHTDNRPLVTLLPSILALRDEIQSAQAYKKVIRVGAGGGIGSPEAGLAAFAMGAAYIVTGSINQACIESGTSDHVRKLLKEADMADVMSAPASDMFEQGVKLQVLKRGTLFPMRAGKLWDFYSSYNSIDEIPASDRQRLEKQTFQRSIASVWDETVAYFNVRDPEQITKALANPRKKMALIFRWYLGLTSHWANSGEKGREMDYQVWCGPSMGAFNDWVRGSYLEKPEQRRVTDVAHHLLHGAAYLYRVQQLKMQQLSLPLRFMAYRPSDQVR